MQSKAFTIDYWLSILQPMEWAVIASAIILSTVITEYIKRNVVWKVDGHKQNPSVVSITVWGGCIEFAKPFIIGFIVSYSFTIAGLYFNQAHIGKIILIPILIGVITPLIYKGTIKYLRHKEWHMLANFISGERRKLPRV